MRLPGSLRLRPTGIFLILLAAACLSEALLSLGWRMAHDAPLLAYAAFLMNEHGLFPYRDFFETSMPGTFALHAAIGALFGYGDLGFRILDLLWLAALMAITWRILSAFGRHAAWAGSLLFALAYFQQGPAMSFQRDYAALLPVACAVLVAVASRAAGGTASFFAIGFLFGLAGTVKPHLLIGLPPLMFYAWTRDAGPEAGAEAGSSTLGAVPAAATTAAGASVPMAASLVWIWWNGAWPRFSEMVFSYLPLHLRLTGEHRTVDGIERIGYLAFEYRRLGGHALWLLPATFGILAVLGRPSTPRRERRLAYLLAGLAALYSLYPVLSGQFFAYHWTPFLYFVIVASALCFAPDRDGDAEAEGPPRPAAPAVLVLSSLLLVAPPAELVRQLRGLGASPPEAGRADAVAAYLRENSHPGDTVQPLDWTGGAIHGMLLARSRLATSFLYDYHFYHHVSDPLVRALRWRFIRELDAAAPRFIVEVPEEKPWVWGPDTTREFPELQARLARDYAVRLDRGGVRVYERHPIAP